MALKSSSYLLAKFSSVSITIVLVMLIRITVNNTQLNFGKRYEDDLGVIFEKWQKLHLDMNALSIQKFLKGIYCLSRNLLFFKVRFDLKFIPSVGVGDPSLLLMRSLRC